MRKCFQYLLLLTLKAVTLLCKCICHFNNLGRWVTYLMIFYLLNTPLLWLLVTVYSCQGYITVLIIMMKKASLKE